MFGKLWRTENFEINSSYSTYKNVVGNNYQVGVKNPQTVGQEATTVTNPINNLKYVVPTGVDELKQKLKISNNIQEKVNFCKNATIDTLISAEDPKENLRCGWIYKKRTGSPLPEINQGALGTFDGPVGEKLPPGAKWFWNLKKSNDTIQSELCATMTSCKDLRDTTYAGKCGWCISRGKGISTYLTSSPNVCGASGDFIQNMSQCPAPPVGAAPDLC